MPYGTIKIDTVTFTDAGVDKSVTLSGLIQNPTFSGNVTVTGTLSGVTVTGTTANFTSGNFTTISGGTHTITSGVFAAGSAASPSITFTGDLNTGIYSPGADQVAISTGGSGRLFINSSGDIGMGTNALINSAGYTSLFLNGSLGGSIGFKTGDVIKQYIYSTATTLNYYGGGSDSHIFYCNTEKMRLTPTGLGVGSSAPQELLNVNGNILVGVDGTATASEKIIRSSNTSTSFGNDSGANLVLQSGAGTGIYGSSIQFRTPQPSSIANTLGTQTTRMTIDTQGRVGIGSNVPPYRLTVKDTADQIHITNPTAGDANSDGFTIGLSGSDAQLINRENGSIILYQNSGEAARIDSSKRLLIGTSSAFTNVYHATTALVQAPLQVRTATNNYNTGATYLNYSTAGYSPVVTLGLSKNDTAGSNTAVSNNNELGYLQFVGNDGTNFRTAAWITANVDTGTVSGTSMPGRLVFSTTADGASSPTERMRITNEGNHLFYSTGGSVLTFGSSRAAGTSDFLLVGTSGAAGVNTGTNRFFVFTNGNVQNTNNSYGAISDIKLKENIVDATSQWDDIKALQVRKYNFKEGQTHTQIGLVAQEVELVSPGLVSESPDRDAEGNDLGTVTKSVNYSVLYMKAVKALQEAMERIETLEAKVAALESA